MRKQFYRIVFGGVLIGIILIGIIMAVSRFVLHSEAGSKEPVLTSKGTRADKSIDEARELIKNQPDRSKGYNMLSGAYMQKARETGDFSLNAKAEESVNRSFKIEPDNFEAIKIKAAILLNYHRFPEALAEAQRALAINSRDHEVFGEIVDAYVELGDYDNAVNAAQKMVDLRPDTASYSRISYLRSLHGDTKGAIEAMKMATDSANPQNPESVAWCRVHLGDELMNAGKLAEAEREYDHALYIFPDYHVALAAKGRARFAAGDVDNAIKYYEGAVNRIPFPDYISALGDLYAKAGRPDEARRQFEQVEFIEKMGNTGGTFSRQLALFWADHDIRLDEALASAKLERAARNDIYGSDILAWCLYKKGLYTEARSEIVEAMRLGTRDARIMYHAGMIFSAAGDEKKGVEYLRQAAAINPAFDVRQADVLREMLKTLTGK